MRCACVSPSCCSGCSGCGSILGVGERIAEDLQDLVAQLPVEQQAVVHMRIHKGMSFKDIAEETDVSINTALGRMRYALINLRRMMAEQDVSLTLD